MQTLEKNPAFNSHLGNTKGKYAPSECAEYWYRFFPRNPQFVEPKDISKKKIKELRTSLHAFINQSAGPLLIKNLVSVLRLRTL